MKEVETRYHGARCNPFIVGRQSQRDRWAPSGGRFRGRDYGYPGRARHQDLVKIAATAYWESRLRDDQSARRWLDTGGFAEELGDQGTFEVKTAT